VGSYIGADYRKHGFLFDQGSYTTLDVPGSTYTWATGINTAGQIVGFYEGAGGYHGFLFDQGSYTTLDVHGPTLAIANGINDSGQIIGSYRDVGGGWHGFLATPVP
jgi:probable HAF family extracellular repeat protein